MSQPFRLSHFIVVSLSQNRISSIEGYHRILEIKLRFKAKNIQNENLSC